MSEIDHSPFSTENCDCRVFTDEEEQTAWHSGYEAAQPRDPEPRDPDTDMPFTPDADPFHTTRPDRC